MKQARLTDWVSGLKVKFITLGKDLNRDYPVGTTGTLFDLERVQDGYEVWTVWVRLSDGRLVLAAANHTQLGDV